MKSRPRAETHVVVFRSRRTVSWIPIVAGVNRRVAISDAVHRWGLRADCLTSVATPVPPVSHRGAASPRASPAVTTATVARGAVLTAFAKSHRRRRQARHRLLPLVSRRVGRAIPSGTVASVATVILPRPPTSTSAALRSGTLAAICPLAVALQRNATEVVVCLRGPLAWTPVSAAGSILVVSRGSVASV